MQIGKVGGGLFASMPLLAGETEAAHWNVNYSQSSNRAVGGRLYLTTQRLVFLPHRVDAATGGAIWAIPRSDVRRVSIRPKGGDSFGGGLRDRLCLGTVHGDLLFVVNKVTKVSDELSRLLAPHP